jgi:16S rRNA (cytosine967-C5)-methyltransferase
VDTFVADRAADVVAAWLAARRSPREQMAAMPLLRDAAPAERAAVARASARAIAGMRRVEFVLAGAAGLRGLAARDRALVLVLAAAVAADELLPATAARQLPFAAAGIDLARLLRAGEAIDATADPVVRSGRRHSVPDWFARAALAQFGDAADAVAAALAEPAPRTVRANLLRVADRDALRTELAAERVAARPGSFSPWALHVDGDADLFATAAFARGAFEQQDEASQLVALVTAPPPGGKVLDLCAGTGGKTLALAAMLRGRGQVMATDVHAGRLAALRERAARAGADNVEVHAGTDAAWAAPVAAFAPHADRVLVDAPCSGTGSWRRRPEGRWTIDERALRDLVRQQDALLRAAAAVLRPGARLVYATCSLLEDENERRVDALRAERPELEPVRVAEILGNAAAAPITDPTGTFLSLRPDRHGCDGFFAAVLRLRRS